MENHVSAAPAGEVQPVVENTVESPVLNAAPDVKPEVAEVCPNFILKLVNVTLVAPARLNQSLVMLPLLGTGVRSVGL